MYLHSSVGDQPAGAGGTQKPAHAYACEITSKKLAHTDPYTDARTHTLSHT